MLLELVRDERSGVGVGVAEAICVWIASRVLSFRTSVR